MWPYRTSVQRTSPGVRETLDEISDVQEISVCTWACLCLFVRSSSDKKDKWVCACSMDTLSGAELTVRPWSITQKPLPSLCLYSYQMLLSHRCAGITHTQSHPSSQALFNYMHIHSDAKGWKRQQPSFCTHPLKAVKHERERENKSEVKHNSQKRSFKHCYMIWFNVICSEWSHTAARCATNRQRNAHTHTCLTHLENPLGLYCIFSNLNLFRRCNVYV